MSSRLRSVLSGMFLVVFAAGMLCAQTTYGAKIETQGWQLFNWISKGLGAIAIASGIAWAAVRRGMGDENALKTGFEIIIAGVVVFASKNIVMMLMEMFGG